MSCGPDVAAEKRAWRARLRAQRAALTEGDRSAAAAALSKLVAGLDLGARVAAYVPVGSEPGSTSLLAAIRGDILLPVTPDTPGGLDWAVYRGELAPGPFGLLEPTGDRLGVDALTSVDTVLLPALGVSRGGVRLGRGAGYYDRSLRGDARLIAVVYDHELVDELPAEPTDVPVHAALTPSGLVAFS
ncbi:5-formyltetrahydrofolate cyclo-ligase OS=Tsukamurella paurometabola (strain ATCC 8368 / DSM/ CCUG 35730 / CIP 100753 / JCM 10117 / KCTC 9821 / NBRC 16120/ NCIMB 702349 / NCTC 13040) OX=521096 GN=Tpau_3269 PE=3 SV=1 [Tsukamurella paurometabola]|uniref:5-formyltetrahydrofolate cyclo-ligase n=1 Tax=Tsukamurella paurometabola (strain ATCC 8368 / DSM 20162 / CCUG 35730 / CIP 100753 / JCM 10117 / KCTC 9821 / NBRC 16120 / NCIMB 702349 / NCTC 13040) TaxID=521096 RepID=D5UVS2_TSUPD|nr:5-formyltetrahydrofolate cyclo-ligase [Tsukamurella paurometabola]ADG79854.1 5-formyltetrahydrofolate cyclo-ligase [Tsukamurella paurometabola DSM 20162]SUP37433.1 5-formyltetrahydrofolate cyclo-ligase family protein [Tsukamurella paurometabola]